MENAATYRRSPPLRVHIYRRSTPDDCRAENIGCLINNMSECSLKKVRCDPWRKHGISRWWTNRYKRELGGFLLPGEGAALKSYILK